VKSTCGGELKRAENSIGAVLNRLGRLLGFDSGVGSSFGGLGSATVALKEECGEKVSCDSGIISSESQNVS